MVNATIRDFVGENINNTARAVFVAMGTAMVVSSVAGNCLLLAVIFKRFFKIRCVHDLFLANLTLADIVAMGYWVSFFVLDMMLGYHPTLNQDHCVANGIIISTVCLVSVTSLVFISANRYLHVCFSHLYCRVFTLPRTITCCVLTWLLAFFLVFPPALVSQTYHYDPVGHICTYRKRGLLYNYMRFLTIFFIFIPILIVGYCHVAIIRFWKKAKMSLRNRYPLARPREEKLWRKLMARWRVRPRKKRSTCAQSSSIPVTDVWHQEPEIETEGTSVSTSDLGEASAYPKEASEFYCEGKRLNENNLTTPCATATVPGLACYWAQDDENEDRSGSQKGEDVKGTAAQLQNCDQTGGTLQQHRSRQEISAQTEENHGVVLDVTSTCSRKRPGKYQDAALGIHSKLSTSRKRPTENQSQSAAYDVDPESSNSRKGAQDVDVDPEQPTSINGPGNGKQDSVSDVDSQLPTFKDRPTEDHVTVCQEESPSSTRHQSRPRCSHSVASSPKNHPDPAIDHLDKRLRKEKARERAFIRSLFVVFILMIITYIPYCIILVFKAYVTLPPEVTILGNLALFINNSVNWIVYGAMNPSFRKEYVKFVVLFTRRYCRIGLARADNQLNEPLGTPRTPPVSPETSRK